MTQVGVLRRARPVLILVLAAIAVLGLVTWYIHSLLASKPQSEKRQVPVVVKLIRPPEPPPEPPPPPEKVEEPIPQNTPEDKPVEQAPETAQLGVDAEGTAGGDSFGLAARAGGRDLVGNGTGPFVWYAGMVKELMQEALSNVDRIRQSKYSVSVRVWLNSDGKVERATLAQSTGDRALDSAIEQTISRVGRVRESPPLEMPQPITFRLVSHT